MKVPNTQLIFRKSMQCIVKILIVFIILVLAIGLVRTLIGMRTILLDQPLGQAFDSIVTDILTFLVIIELFRSFIEYFEVHRLRLNTMIDPAIVFVIRELIVKLYDTGHLQWQTLMALGFVVICLGIVRTLAVTFSPDEDKKYQEGMHNLLSHPKNLLKKESYHGKQEMHQSPTLGI
ncbi:MAG: phosphate-starvation-inducible PsiE family protein [Deltaproteobacteria bacterium]|nr:phosphate-starvation-inducible PsiE family protein [Deltaproteobacteria bacterium]